MRLINAKDICSLFNKVLKDGWGVVSGFDGQVLTKDMVNEIKDENVKQSASKWIGKHVVDAGGLFAHAFRSMGMIDGYTSDGTYPQTIFNEFCIETGKLPKGGLLPGFVVFKKRGDAVSGVALYVGNGRIINAKSSKVGIINEMLNSEWNYWGKLANVEYEGFASKATIKKREEKDLRILRGPAIVVGNDKPINIREEDRIESKIIDQLPVGTSTTVLEDHGTYCKIQYLKTGYMMKKYLKGVNSNAAQ